MKKSTVLVVDDELFFRRLYADLLISNGYQVETVASGEDAVVRLRAGGIDLAVIDLVMPGIDGLEVLEQARQLENPPEVILATGHATVETAITALKKGARDYLVKPFDPAELLHVVRTCVEQRHLLDENTHLKSQIRLYEKGQILASRLDFEQLFTEALAAILHETRGGRGFAWLMPETGEIELAALQDLRDEEALTLLEGLAPYLEQPGILQILTADRMPNLPSQPRGMQTVGLFPLSSSYGLCGALAFCNPVEGDFCSPLPRKNLLFLLEQTALGFENACRYKNARDLIFIDDLTGLHNFRYLQVILDQEIHRAERYGLEFSLIFVDIDFFKQVNDTRGHLAGSQALREIAILLQQSVRDSDLLFRYGGDEFTGFLVETGSQGAAIVAERIRASIEQHEFLAGTEHPARLTATIGYATFPGDANSKQAIIHLADLAMYEGKKNRNVVRGAWQLQAEKDH
jgi:two-component system, cell cycle response regulator